MRPRTPFLAVLVSTLLALGVTLPAAAAPTSWGVGPISNWPGSCLDVRGSRLADGTPVQLQDCNRSAGQVWTINDDETLTVGGHCLAVTGGATSGGSPVEIWRCTGRADQRWRVRSNGQIVNPASGLCLTSPGDSADLGEQMVIGTCTQSGVQHWILPWGLDPVPLGVDGHWRLTFDDEFAGSSLDAAKWSTGWFGTGVTGPVNKDHEKACYAPRNVSVSGGSLRMAVVKRNITCSGMSMSYAGGLVTTEGRYEFAYGYAEARMYLPGRNGRIDNWPAFWADGHDWPTTGEMDVLEALDGGQACWHFHAAGANDGGCATGDFTGWHTYGAAWEPGRVTYYYDGVPVGTATHGITGAPMFLVVDSTVGDTSIPRPGSIAVDYVRVWQH